MWPAATVIRRAIPSSVERVEDLFVEPHESAVARRVIGFAVFHRLFPLRPEIEPEVAQDPGHHRDARIWHAGNADWHANSLPGSPTRQTGWVRSGHRKSGRDPNRLALSRRD